MREPCESVANAPQTKVGRTYANQESHSQEQSEGRRLRRLLPGISS